VRETIIFEITISQDDIYKKIQDEFIGMQLTNLLLVLPENNV